MSVSKINVRDAAQFDIVRPGVKSVGLAVTFNGSKKPLHLNLNETRDLQFGNFTVKIELVEIYDKK